MTSTKIQVRIPLAMDVLLDAKVRNLQQRHPHRKVTRSEVVREALAKFLK